MNAATIQTLDRTRAVVAPAYVGARPDATRRGPNWIVLALIAAVHVAGLWALVTFDVIQIARAVPKPLVMTLIPETAPPPPVAPPPPPAAATVPDTPTPPQVVAPVRELAVVAPSATIAVAPAAPAPAPSAPPAASAPPAPAAVPITPPSANASTLDNPAPRYPIDARRKRQEGTVRLRVVITVEGRVKEIGVAASSGFASLDEAALSAVKRWRFLPGMQAGQPVEAVGFVPIPFRLTA